MLDLAVPALDHILPEVLELAEAVTEAAMELAGRG